PADNLQAMDVRMFTVGPVQENCFLFRRDGSSEALIVDPGDEAPKLLGAIESLGLELKGVLLTHTHFDHVGARAPVPEATGAGGRSRRLRAGRPRQGGSCRTRWSAAARRTARRGRLPGRVRARLAKAEDNKAPRGAFGVLPGRGARRLLMGREAEELFARTG